MQYTALIGTIATSVGGLFGVRWFCFKLLAASGGSEREALLSRLKSADKHLRSLLKYVDSYVSRKQCESLAQRSQELQESLDREKGALEETEIKLKTAQSAVEEKETAQQELKSAKEEDELKLEELMAGYSEVSSESSSLERRIAESMKNLDNLMEQLELTAAQKSAFDELSKALTIAGALLRDLITEHSSLNERLELLRGQHDDLEDEYTRLVERQLGE